MLLWKAHLSLALTLTFLVALLREAAHGAAAESGLVTPAGLEKSVEFWKQVFGKHDGKTVLFFDPFDQATVYSTLKSSDAPAARAALEKERRRILAEYDLDEEMGRLRVQRGARDQFLSGLRIAGRYLPEMKKIFREQELPTDLAYLPLVESSFNLRARSPVGAAGIWQFMPDTGRKFLRIDNTIDERLDPIASTRAAAKLLKENQQILGSWPLAITAYNHGTEGMFQAIERLGTRNLAEIVRRYKSPTFGFASQNFYAEFLAVVYLAKNGERYFPFLRTQQPLVFREWTVNRPIGIEALLKPAAIAPKDFQSWNPALTPGLKTLAAGHRINLPADKYEGVVAAQQRAAEPPAVRSNPAPLKVARAPAAKKRAAVKEPTKVVLAAAKKPSKTSLERAAAPRLKVAKRRDAVVPAG